MKKGEEGKRRRGEEEKRRREEGKRRRREEEENTQLLTPLHLNLTAHQYILHFNKTPARRELSIVLYCVIVYSDN